MGYIKAIKFTKGHINALTPSPEGVQWYVNTENKRLLLAVQPKGSKTFYFYRKYKGRKLRFMVGTWPDTTLEMAEVRVGEYAKRVDADEDVLTTRKDATEEKTLNEFFQTFLTRHAKPHKKSWKYDEGNYNTHVAKALGNKKLSAINQTHIHRLHTTIAETRGQVIANRVLSLLVVMFNKAKEWGDYKRDAAKPTDYVHKFKEKSRDRFLQGEELPSFFAALHQEADATMRDYLLVSLFTGARKANVLSMTWHELDLARGVWVIPETKNGESLTLPLVDEVVEILKKRRQHTSSIFVFEGRGHKGHFADPKKGWKRLLKAATVLTWEQQPSLKRLCEEVRKQNEDKALSTLFDIIQAKAADELITLPNTFHDLHIHDLRRTLGSWQTIAGASPFIVGRSLGHKDLKSTQIYARLNLDPVRESIKTATSLMVNMGEIK